MDLTSVSETMFQCWNIVSLTGLTLIVNSACRKHMEHCRCTSINFIVVSDDSVSDQTTSLSDVTGYDTRLHWRHTTQNCRSRGIWFWSSVVEVNWTENTDVYHISKQWLACRVVVVLIKAMVTTAIGLPFDAVWLTFDSFQLPFYSESSSHESCNQHISYGSEWVSEHRVQSWGLYVTIDWEFEFYEF